MKYAFLILILLLLGGSWNGLSGQDLETYYEKSGGKETPRYDKTIRYCKQLAQASPWVLFTRFGMSPQGRELPLLVIDRQGHFDPESVHRSRNAVIMIQAGIHAGEPDGKDAGLMLIRDMVVTKKYEDLLKNVTILFIPILNVDGHERFGPYNRINQNGPMEMGWRTNAQNLNLNRDFLKAESPELRSWLALFQEWLPDFVIDCHVTNGADYQYAVTYGIEPARFLDENVASWQSNDFIKTVENKMTESGFPIIRYVTFRNWHDPRSGLETWSTSPMLSHGYCAVQNRPGLLIETHMLKDYKTRVTATYEMLRHSLFVLNRDYRTLIDMVREADNFTQGPIRTTPFPIRYEVDRNDSVMVDFLGIEYSKNRSDLTGGDWFTYGTKAETFTIPYFDKIKPVKEVSLPEAYLIPPEYTEVIMKIKLHGIQSTTLPRETRIMVSSYRFTDVKFQNTPYEGRMTVSFKADTFSEERDFPRGTVIVPMNQRTARVIAYLLEPEAASSLASWGYFNSIFEQKEYVESYVMEPMAREMIKNNPELLLQLQEKKRNDPEFAKNPRAILNWFYSKTPYWDAKKDVYPIGKVYDTKILQTLTY